MGRGDDRCHGRHRALGTYPGEGHGFVLASSCIVEAESNVLTDLVLLDDGLACHPDPDVERPDWWDDLPTPDGVSGAADVPEVFAALGLTPDQAYAELRISEKTLDPDAVLTAYESPLEAAGFTDFGRQEPIPGVEQGIYQSPGEEVFSVLVLGPDALADPDLGNLDDARARWHTHPDPADGDPDRLRVG